MSTIIRSVAEYTTCLLSEALGPTFFNLQMGITPQTGCVLSQSVLPVL